MLARVAGQQPGIDLAYRSESPMQRFLSRHGEMRKLIQLRCHHLTAIADRPACVRAFQAWRGAAGVTHAT